MTLEEIAAYVENCEWCGLCKTRHLAVPGQGSAAAKLMFVAEAPGRQEDLRGIPFVGPAGRLFDQLLAECGLAREEVYITNVVKCRPPDNRDPAAGEKQACLVYLRHETAALRPKWIVCLGRVAAQELLAPDYKLTKDHGTWIARGSYLLTATFHPSALLRDETKLPAAREDFAEIARAVRAAQ